MDKTNKAKSSFKNLYESWKQGAREIDEALLVVLVIAFFIGAVYWLVVVQTYLTLSLIAIGCLLFFPWAFGSRDGVNEGFLITWLRGFFRIIVFFASLFLFTMFCVFLYMIDIYVLVGFLIPIVFVLIPLLVLKVSSNTDSRSDSECGVVDIGHKILVCNCTKCRQKREGKLRKNKGIVKP